MLRIRLRVADQRLPRCSASSRWRHPRLTTIRLLTPSPSQPPHHVRPLPSGNRHSTSPRSVTQPWPPSLAVCLSESPPFPPQRVEHSFGQVRIGALRRAGQAHFNSVDDPLTPRTRYAVPRLRSFSDGSTHPVSVTMPSLTATPISLGRMRHPTSFFQDVSLICSSVRVLTAMVCVSFPFVSVSTQLCQGHCLTGESPQY